MAEVIIDKQIRCWRCKNKLAEFSGRPWLYVCDRCKATNHSQPPIDREAKREYTESN